MVQSTTCQPHHPASRHYPKELGPDSVGLYPCPGRVWPVVDYATRFSSTLGPWEEALIQRHAKTLASGHIADRFAHCLSRSAEFASENVPAYVARRSGSRSAYLPELRLKFKGCRPVEDGSTYPLEVLPPGAQSIEYTRIPFGTMSAEGVMRELLGWAFHREHGLPVQARPVCVFEYTTVRQQVGCCLVLESRGEDRIEGNIEYPACTVGEIIRANHEGLDAVGGAVIGSELKLRGVNLWWYVEQKSRLLCAMHFHGGFRGILNSNIGNDVLLSRATGGPELCLCDFDTFHVAPVPTQPDQAFLNEFVLRAMIEVVKGSLSICDYVEVPERASVSEVAQVLGRVYFGKSSLWRAYARQFERVAKARNWNVERTRAAFAEALRTAALGSVLASSIVNSHYLREMTGDRAVFYPHN